MIIFDALVWLALAKLAVLVFDDLVSAARGKRSPRLQARDQRRAAEARGTAPASGWGRRTGGGRSATTSPAWSRTPPRPPAPAAAGVRPASRVAARWTGF